MTTQLEIQKRDFLIGIVLCAALVLRLISLGDHSFWLDEIYSLTVASKGLSDLISQQLEDTIPPLYYLFLNLWTRLFGLGEFQSRFPSLLFNLATCGLVFLFAKKYLDIRTAFFAAVLFALSPNQIYYSQEARAYSLLSLLSFLTVFSYWSAIDKNELKHWIAFSVVTVLTLLTHLNGIFLMMGLWLYQFLFYSRRNEKTTRFLWSQLAFLFTLLIWMIGISRYLGRNAQWMEDVKAFSLFESIEFFCCTGWKMAQTPVENDMVFWGACLFSLLLVYAAYRTIQGRDRIAALLWFAGLAPMLLAFAVSLQKPIYLPGRYDIQFFPPLILLACYGMSRLPRSLGAGALVLIVLMNGYFLNLYFNQYKKSADRDMAEILRSNTNDGDVIVFSNLTRGAANYYSPNERQTRITLPTVRAPAALLPSQALNNDARYAASEIQFLLRRFRLIQPENLWYVYNHSPIINLAFLERLNQSFRFVERVDVKPGRNENQPEAMIRYSGNLSGIRTADWPEEQLSLEINCEDAHLCLAFLKNKTVDRKKIRMEVFPVDRYMDYTEFQMEGDWKISHQWNPYPPPRFNLATALVSTISRNENSPRLIGNFNFEPGFTRIWIHTFAETSYDTPGNSRAAVRLEIGSSEKFFIEPSLGLNPSDWVFFPMGTVYRPQEGNLPMIFSLVHNGKHARENFDLRGVILNRVDSRKSKLTRNRVSAELAPQSTYKWVIPWEGEKFLVWVLTNPKTGRRFDFVLPPKLQKKIPQG